MPPLPRFQKNIELLVEETYNNVGIVGIVFPVCYYGIPLMVKEFIEKLRLKEETYIFAVATCGGSVGMAFKQIEDILLKKGNLPFL